MPSRTVLLTYAFELGLNFVGLVLLWRLALKPQARFRQTPTALAAWNAPVSDFLLFLLLVLCGSMGGAALAGFGLKSYPLEHDPKIIFIGAASQLGMLAGA